jgi:hypothetical protein
MQYETTPIKNSKELGKQVKSANLDKIKTGTILWHLVKRHKFVLVTTYAIVLTVLYMLPFLPDVLTNLF